MPRPRPATGGARKGEGSKRMALRFRLTNPLVHFLYPGIKLKRWITLLMVSAVVFTFGLGGFLGGALKQQTFHVQPLRKVERKVRTYFKHLRSMDVWLIVLGSVGMLFAIRRGYYSILAVYFPNREGDFMRMAYERARRKRGPRIVVIGGGTGLSTLLMGIKEYSDNLTAVVTVADDGGSSGRLRRQFGTLPPGDFRNCLVALADAEPLMGKLFQHRFSHKGGLSGHTFGNLFLMALAEVSGDFSSALTESSRVLAVRGRVIPVTLDLVMLAAKLKNGKYVRGESRIAKAGSPIERLQLHPAQPRPNPEAVREMSRADIVVLGPGSLYSSVIPNVLVPEIPETLALSRALKIYVCNVMTEPGETDGMSAADHLETLIGYLGAGIVNAIVVNVEEADPMILERYAGEKAYPVAVEEDRLKKLGVKVIRGRLLASGTEYIRHDSAKLSRAIMKYAAI